MCHNGLFSGLLRLTLKWLVTPIIGVSGIVLGKIMAHLLLAARYLTLHTADACMLIFYFLLEESEWEYLFWIIYPPRN